MQPLSIVMVAACPFPANHGSPASIREMSQSLALLGHEVHVVTYPFGQDIPLEGIKVHRAGAFFGKGKVSVGPTWYKPFLDLFLVVKLCSVIYKEKIDIIHAHNYEGAIAGFIAKKLTGRPMIYNAVNNMIDELPSYGFIRPKSLAVLIARFLDMIVPKMGNFITVVSDELYQFMKGKGIPEDRLEIIPAGVNPGMFEGIDGDVMRKRYNVDEHPLIVYTGTLDQFQRIDLLLTAMRTVLDRIKDAVLIIVGNIIREEDLNEHRRLSMKLGLNDNVIFTDERPLAEIPFFLASADIAVVPRPTCPGFPVKLLNYMAAGKGIVSFAGSAKGLKDMENAIVVQGSGGEDLGEGILRILTDPVLAERLGCSAQKTVREQFAWSVLAKKIDGIYRKILKQSGEIDNGP